MKREHVLGSTIWLECGHHKVPLVSYDGPPYMVPVRGVPGGFTIDPSDMDCPALPEDASDAERNRCASSWRGWTEA